MNLSDYRLCYADANFLWFTTCPLDKQWGDDWNDAPWWCNSGEPYEWEEYRDVPKYDILKVAWSGSFYLPHIDSLSVDNINNDLRSPWLIGSSHTILAGTPFLTVCEILGKEGGKMYYLFEVHISDTTGNEYLIRRQT